MSSCYPHLIMNIIDIIKAFVISKNILFDIMPENALKMTTCAHLNDYE